jgi:FolB domain-containing protein
MRRQVITAEPACKVTVISEACLFLRFTNVSLPLGKGHIKTLGPGSRYMRIASKKTGRILDEIRIRDFVIPCTIGIYPEEALRTQALRLNLVLFLDTSVAARSGQLGQSVDYSVLVKEIRFILTQGHFRLLESAAEALATFILAPNPLDILRVACDAVEIEIIKPEALNGVSIPAIRIFREKEENIPAIDVPIWNMIFSSPETCLFRGNVLSQSSLRPWLPGWNVAAIMTGSAGLKISGRCLASAEELLATDVAEQSLHNDSDEARSFLAVARRDPKMRSVGASIIQPAAAIFSLN